METSFNLIKMEYKTIFGKVYVISIEYDSN